MSSLQIMDPTVPLAEPLLERRDRAKPKNDNKSNNIISKLKFVLLGIITRFFIFLVSLGAACAFVLALDPAQQANREDDVALTNAASTVGFLKQRQNEYAFLIVFKRLDIVLYMLLILAEFVWFSCQLFVRPFFNVGGGAGNNHGGSNEDGLVFVLSVYFLVGCNLGDLVVWTAIDLYLGIPTPFKYILGTVVVDLLCCGSLLWAYNVSKKIRLRGGGAVNGKDSKSSPSSFNNEEKNEREISFCYDSEEDEDDEEASSTCC